MSLRYLRKNVVGEHKIIIKKNLFMLNGKSLVSKVKVKNKLKDDVRKAVDLIGGFKKIIKKGDSVLIKPNYVFPVEYPCCTANDFLDAVIELVKEAGAFSISVGECSFFTHKTKKIMEMMGALKVCDRQGVEVIDFGEGEWVDVGFDKIGFPKRLFEFDKVIYISNMKVHHLAKFSMSLKHTMGLTYPRDRFLKIHGKHLERNIADFNKAVYPDLIIMDARRCYVTEGPRSGEIKEPGLIFASGDRVAIDAEGLKVLLSYKADNLLNFKNPFQYEQIKRAAENGLGALSEKDIKLVF